ncbi:glycosyltransferase [Candidatus Peregrinibacteria bacterium]|nr:glycosyltransferase [Candidatus Peregrinibacteria bacterium]
MKIALVHELLTMKGGAERVLRILTEMFPDAPIYTLLYDEKKLGDWFPKERIRTSTLQKFARFSSNHHYYLPWFPQAIEQWDFSEFDLVISSSSAFAHGIITNGKPKHLCYVHSPARYLWDRTHDVLQQNSKGFLGPLKRWYLSHLFHRLRIWDAESADRPDMLLAASREVERRIELYWRRESTVVYPPVENYWFESSPCHDKNYFLIVSTLVPYKRIEIAIKACNQLKLPLKIAGEGPHRKKLERLSGPTIEFLGYKEHPELKNLYTHATATIVPGEEDFGLVPLESMACGTPVIAYRKGGVLETILEGKTGTFFDDQNSLMNVLRSFDRTHFQPASCKEHAKSFSRSHFEHAIQSAIDALQ